MSDNLLGQATFSGDVATFGTAVALSSGVDYYIVCNCGVSSYTRDRFDNGGATSTRTLFDFTSIIIS